MPVRAQASIKQDGRATGGRARDRSTARAVAPPRYGVDIADVGRVDTASNEPLAEATAAPGGGRTEAARAPHAPPGPQAKLTIGEPNDAFEREAEQVAEAVTNMPAVATSSGAEIDGAVGQGAEPVADFRVGRNRAAGAGSHAPSADTMNRAARFAIRHKGPGDPIAPALHGRLEAGTGTNLGEVRVHSDSVAHTAARGLQARAFTYGKDIWLGRGESPSDLRLMAHESTHVAQQGGILRRLNSEASPAAPAPTSGTASAAIAPSSPATAERPPRVPVEPLPAAPAPAPAPGPAPVAEAPAAPAEAPVSSAPAPAGGEVELLMPEPPEELSEAERERITRVQREAGEAAQTQEALPSAGENVTEARQAVQEPAEETTARAEGGLAAALGARPEPSAEIEALCERIVAAIRARRPPDEDSLLTTNPREEAQAAGGALQSSVEGDVERVEGSYEQLNEQPQAEPQQRGQALETPPASVATSEVGAQQAVPDAVRAKDVSLAADVEASAGRMQEVGMESEPAGLVQSGPIAEARAAQGELAATAQRDPAEVLAEQEAARGQAAADMADLQQRALEALQAARAGTVTGIGSQQQGMVTSEEQLRAQIGTRAQAIFDSAQTRVNDLLEPLTATAMQRWQTGVEVLSTRFEQDLDRIERWKQERYEGVGGAILEVWEGIVGLPDWVVEAYNRAERNFGDGVCNLIREISAEVNGVIATCEQIIDDANADIAELFGNLPEGLEEWGAAEQARFAEQLDGLHQRVVSTRDDFNRNLAEQAAESVQQVRERIHELRQAAGGLIGRIQDAIDRFLDDPARFIIEGLLELVGIPPASFWAVVDRIQTVIQDIADDPMNFANNLVAALAQGFRQFFDNFADHILGGFFDWLFSGLGAVGVNIPSDFSLKSIITFFLELMGITWPRIREVLARHIGEENVALIEKAYELVATLIEQGPEGIFEMIKEQLNPQTILDQVIDAAIDFLIETLIVRVTTRVLA
ncbi:MAG: DUF4157 domain-containing protein, partial [Rhodospirillales bacterium]|nr:DUF4157 domain-containing protein [Rhodospirillales bacterium]